MRSLKSSIANAFSLILVLALAQFYFPVMAAPSSADEAKLAGSTGVFGTLTTSEDKPILVNGTSAATDTTILSGATLETSEGIAATVHLGTLGTFDASPNASARIGFSEGLVTVTLVKGCGSLSTGKNTTGIITGVQGDLEKRTAHAEGGAISLCVPLGSSSRMNGAASSDLPFGSDSATGADTESACGTCRVQKKGGLWGWGAGKTFGILTLLGALTVADILIVRNELRGRPASPSQP